MVRSCGRRRGEVEGAICDAVGFEEKTIAPCYPILVQLLSDRRSEIEAGVIPDCSDYVNTQTENQENLELKGFIGDWWFSWFWVWSLLRAWLRHCSSSLPFWGSLPCIVGIAEGVFKGMGARDISFHREVHQYNRPGGHGLAAERMPDFEKSHEICVRKEEGGNAGGVWGRALGQP